MIDTHIHLDGSEYADDLDAVMQRSREAGVEQVLLPSVTLESAHRVLAVCQQYRHYARPMIGLHPEEVRADWSAVLDEMQQLLRRQNAEAKSEPDAPAMPFVGIGEVGLDYYWSREFEREQQLAFERQIEWSIEYKLPLMLHVRKAQNEAVKILRRYQKELTRGGVFHCFSGNAHEAEELLSFDGFALGIGGIVTFKKATLPETLRTAVPLDRIVLETDGPYLAPTPLRGQRNESAFLVHIAAKLAEVYDTDPSTIDRITTATARRLFNEV